MNIIEPQLISNGVSRYHADECMEWAFGQGWQQRNFLNSHLKFNELHPNLDPIIGSEPIEKSIAYIAKSYLDMRAKQAKCDKRGRHAWTPAAMNPQGIVMICQDCKKVMAEHENGKKEIVE